MSDIFKIGLVAPSRIGKTTLIASIFHQVEKHLDGTKLHIEASEETYALLQHNFNALETSMSTGRLLANSLKGTEDTTKYKLIIKSDSRGENAERFDLHILDYPGGWLTTQSERWREECKPWIEESGVLIVPVDATLLVEPVMDRDRESAFYWADMVSTGKVIRRWASSLKKRGENGLMLFVLVKTETYFKDNGGYRDDNRKLWIRFEEMYGRIIEQVWEDMGEDHHLLQMEYHPVDTLGFVDLQRIKWFGIDAAPSVSFLCRNPSKFRPLGADGVFSSVMKLILDYVRVHENSRMEGVDKNLNQKRNWLRKFHYWASGKKKKDKKAFLELKENVQSLGDAIEMLSEVKHSSRFKKISSPL